MTIKETETPFKAQGYHAIFNCLSLLIEISTCGTCYRLKLSGENCKPTIWKEFEYNTKGNPFARFEQSKYELSNFMKL